MNMFTRVAMTVLLLAGALAAQDFSGKWVGVADTTDEGGTKRQERTTIEIKTDGKLAGTRLNRAGTGGTAVDVQQDGAKVNLYEYLTLDGGEHLHWKVELKDGKLVGMYYVTHNNPAKWVYDRTGAVTFSKAEPAK